MSIVTATRGKGKTKKTVQFKGKVSKAKWAEFKAKLKALAKRYQIHVARGRKRKKKKAR